MLPGINVKDITGSQLKNAMQKQSKRLERPKYEKSRSARRLQHSYLGNHRPIETFPMECFDGYTI